MLHTIMRKNQARTIRTLLVACVLLFAQCRGDVSLFGMFQNLSSSSMFEKASEDLEMTTSSTQLQLNFSQGLSHIIASMKKAKEDIKRSNSSMIIVFSDAEGFKSDIVKESMTLQYTITSLNGHKDILYDNGLSGHQQKSLQIHMADSMLSLLDTLQISSKAISIVVDETVKGQNTLTRLIQKGKEAGKTIASFTTLRKQSIKQDFLSSTENGNDIILVDCNGKTATELFEISEEIGLAGLQQTKWILSKRTMDSWFPTCSLPDGKYHGLQLQDMALNTTYIVNKVLNCKGQKSTTRNCLASFEPATKYQLWKNHKVASGSSWISITDQNETADDAIIRKEGFNPFLPRLRVSVAETVPWMMVTEFVETPDKTFPCGRNGRIGIRATSNTTEFVCMHGFAIDTLKGLETRLQFVGIAKISKDGKYGTFNENTGEVDGIVGELARNEADLGIDLMEDKTRNKAISFTTPYGITSFALAHLQQYNYKEADIFEPFSTALWLSVIGVIGLLIIIVWIWERVSPYSQHQVNKRSTEYSRTFDFDDSATYIMGTFFTGEIIDQKPKTFGSHVAIIIFSFVSILVISAYSANLITFLVVLDESPLVTGLLDDKLVGDSSKLRIGIHSSSVVSGYLKSHSNGKVRRLYRTRTTSFEQFKDAVKALKNKKLDLIMYDYFSLAYSQSVDRDCSIKVIRLSNAAVGVAVSFSNTSTWKRRLNLAIVDLVNSGEADMILKKWFNQQICSNSNVFYSLDVKRMSSLFVWLSVGILGCIVTMIAVKSFSKLRNICMRKMQTESR